MSAEARSRICDGLVHLAGGLPGVVITGVQYHPTPEENAVFILVTFEWGGDTYECGATWRSGDDSSRREAARAYHAPDQQRDP